MTRTTARLRLVAAAVAGAAVLAGCGDTGVGVAARVGGARITVDEIVERVDRGLDSPAARRVDRVELQRAWLTQLIKSRLYHEGVRRLDAVPSPGEYQRLADEFLRAEGGRDAFGEKLEAAGVDPADMDLVIGADVMFQTIADVLVRDVATPDEALRASYAKRLAEFDQAHIAHILLADKAKADGIARQVRAGGDFKKLAEQSLDASTAPNGGDLGVIGNGDKRFNTAFVQAVFGAKTGAVVGPLKTEGGWEIVKVIERRTVSFEQARDFVRRGLIEEQRNARRAEYLRKLRRELGISVSPRFGRWNDEEFRVVAGGDGLSTTVPSPAGPGGAVPVQ